MKTLNTILLTTLFTIASMVAMSKNNAEQVSEAKNVKDLSSTIQQMIWDDFHSGNNFFYKNGINRLKENVEIKFLVSENGELIITHVKCDNCDAGTYVKKILNHAQIKAHADLKNKNYKLRLNLDYRT